MTMPIRRSLSAVALALLLAVAAACTGAGASPSSPVGQGSTASGSPASSLAPPASAEPSLGPSGGSSAGSSARSSAGSSAAASGGGGTGACPSTAPPPLPDGETRTVTIETSKGTIKLKIDGSLAPNAAGNFVALAECGFYTGVVFHRLVPDFVIQGGDGEYGRAPNVNPELVGTGGPGYTIQDQEVKGEYKRGTLAMARTSAPNSQGSQFFIVLTDDPAGPILESYRTYAIFGEVVEGMDVVDAIAAMPNSGDQTGNQALQPVAMDKVTVASP